MTDYDFDPKKGTTVLVFLAYCPNCQAAKETVPGYVSFSLTLGQTLMRKYWEAPDLTVMGTDALHRTLEKRRKLICPVCGVDNTYVTLDFNSPQIFHDDDVDLLDGGDQHIDFRTGPREDSESPNPVALLMLASASATPQVQLMAEPENIAPMVSMVAIPDSEPPAELPEAEPVVKKTAAKKTRKKKTETVTDDSTPTA